MREIREVDVKSGRGNAASLETREVDRARNEIASPY